MSKLQQDNISNNSSPTNSPPNSDELLMLQLRDILLRKDRDDIKALKYAVETPEGLSEKVSPIIEYHLQMMKRNFPKEYQKEVERIIEKKLKSSQDDILNIVYPVMGKMVKKFVEQQFVGLRESVDNKVSSLFSKKGVYNRLKSIILGVKESDVMLSRIGGTNIEEVYVIERDSGLLMGHFSRGATVDSDVIAGMLTAIKSFVEDAFRKEKQELEVIEYGTYKIYIQSFYTYYVAVVLSGSLPSSERSMLQNKIHNFVEAEVMPVKDNITFVDNQEILSEKLVIHFAGEQEPE